ncbi:MAG: hypothetical protein HY658_09545, partial [Actinobacteria bacterium]|nr:hypothetical protein [Actinomycetota bacterium]
MSRRGGRGAGGRRLVYYPFIEIANGPWLRQALFYWDNLSSIVPESMTREGWEMPPELAFLASEGVYEPVFPTLALRHWTRELDETMRQAVRSRTFLDAVAHDEERFLLHTDKVSGWLFRRLSSQGLAVMVDRDWYEVGRTTGFLYMALLAKIVCRVHGPSVPGTDVKEYEDWLFPRATQGEGLACLDVTFQSVLPVPADDAALDDILGFR